MSNRDLFDALEGNVMQRSSQEAAIGLLGDYCRLFHEATFLLQLLARASEDERLDEFDALEDVHAESLPIHHALLGSLTGIATSDPWATASRRLTAELHAAFDRVISLGEALMHWGDKPVPNEVIQHCGVVERGGAALAREWIEHDLDAVKRTLRDVRLHLDAFDQVLNAHQPA